MNWTVISSANNDTILKSCLLASPDLQSASEVIIQRGFSSAAMAYNDAIDKANGDLLVFVHQDVYFPKGWIDSLAKALNQLSFSNPHWGVVGVWGDLYSGGPPGYLYWTGVDGTAGKPFEAPREVRSLDEIVLIFRKSSGLRFDERLPGFHMYGTDICLEARRHGRKCYVFSGFCIHNTNVYDLLPLAFWRSYLFVRKKWKSELPINTPCIDITWSCWPMVRWIVVRAANIMLGRHKPGQRVADPAALYQDMEKSGLVQAPLGRNAEESETCKIGGKASAPDSAQICSL